MARAARVKGELMDLRVEPANPETLVFAVSALRAMHPGCTVRQYKRVVRADGEAQAVVMIVTRRRLP